MPPSENVTNLMEFGNPRAGRRNRAESVPFIHEKWRRSNDVHIRTPRGNLERVQEDERDKLIYWRLRLGIRVLQMICSYYYYNVMGRVAN